MPIHVGHEVPLHEYVVVAHDPIVRDVEAFAVKAVLGVVRVRCRAGHGVIVCAGVTLDGAAPAQKLQ